MTLLVGLFSQPPVMALERFVFDPGILYSAPLEQINVVLLFTLSWPNPIWFLVTTLAIFIGVYAIMKLSSRRAKVQQGMLEKLVEERTEQINEQKLELEKQSKELQKAYEEIKVKNMAIEEAFEHLSASFTKISDANREKDGMMSVVAHDLRAPLNNIEGLMMLIDMDGDLNDQQLEYVKQIKAVVKRGNELIRDLLDISQARNRKKKLDLSEFSVVDFVNNWRLSFEESMLTKEQKLDVTGEFESLSLHTDQNMLSRVLDNLMSNALKFSEKGTTVHLDITPMEEKIQITLRDEGPGISEEDQKKMFKPFTQLSARPTNGEPTNGLGLSIIKTLVRHLKGKLELESTLGEGTSFIITIPQSVAPAEVVEK